MEISTGSRFWCAWGTFRTEGTAFLSSAYAWAMNGVGVSEEKKRGSHFIQGVWDKKLKSEFHNLQICKDTTYCKIDIFYNEEVVIKSQERRFLFD
ncbi:MAG TPA: hypothetical protein VLX68_17205 [Chitinivibrionales bacterium]|nr:hypothetical protein [Chitinivibrionales bacterium]